MSTSADGGEPARSVRRRPGRPKLTEPSPEYRQRLADIIEMATAVFHEHGYDSGSLDDVAAALGLSKPSLYHYFRSKGQLLYFIFDRALTIGLQRLATLSSIENPQQRVAALIAHQVRMVTTDPTLFAVFFDSRPRLDDEYRDVIIGKEREYVGRFAALVDGAVLDRSFAATEGRIPAYALIGMTSWLYKWFDPARDDRDQITRTMIQLILGDGVDVDAALLCAADHAVATAIDTRG
jgi:AcrR family transcriptional regulator